MAGEPDSVVVDNAGHRLETARRARPPPVAPQPEPEEERDMATHLLDPATTVVNVPVAPEPSADTGEGLAPEEAAARAVFQNALADAAAISDRTVQAAAARRR